MESDDDYQSLSPPHRQPSPPPYLRRLKRLKKANAVIESTEEISPTPPPPIDSLSESQDLEVSRGIDVVGDELENRSTEAKRALDFDDVDAEEKSGAERSKKKRDVEKDSNGSKEKKEKKKRARDGGYNGEKPKSSKRKEKKERKSYLQQLHVESQKLLRETRDASFKPIPVAHKPISSVLEKIRLRKLEVLKKTIGQNSNCSLAEENGPLREIMAEDNLEKGSSGQREAKKLTGALQEATAPGESNSDGTVKKERLEEAAMQLREVLDDQPMHAFRAPVDDTQDLFSDSETSEGKDEMFMDQNSSPHEEVFAPSLLAMNLKFDSAPPDEISSSDEDDNDKENFVPDLGRVSTGCSSPKGDPVKAFVDEEAVEEDDSDHDMRPQENEDDNNDDFEELKDLIATDYADNPIDNDMRNELHQKWLEQQDAAGTENLLQKLKYGSKHKEASLFDDEQEEDATDDDEFCYEATEEAGKESVARINTRKVKQMIPQMFSDNNDGYLSSDEEEAERRLARQRILSKVEEQTTLVSPAEDENSREVFGRIKKLNIVPDNKKKAKTLSFFDKMLTGGNTNDSSKPSFVGRKGNHSVPSSHKQGTSTVRSFIFGRDDSNSRSSLSISEDSCEAIVQETRPAKNVTTKFTCSQFKFSTQVTKTIAQTTEGASLFEILNRSSTNSNVGGQDNTVGLTQTVFAAFKVPKKPVKFERRI